MAVASVVWLCCVWHEGFMSCSQGASEDLSSSEVWKGQNKLVLLLATSREHFSDATVGSFASYRSYSMAKKFAQLTLHF